MALSKRWKEPEQAYRDWYKSQHKFALGKVQYVKVEDDIVVANMIGQHNIRNLFLTIKEPIRYDSVEECLLKVANDCKKTNATVHMPRIGCGLAGGKWEIIEDIINRTLIANDIDVYVYDFE